MRRTTALMMAFAVAGALLGSSCGGNSNSTEKFCTRARDADVSGDKVDSAITSGDPKLLERSVNDALDAAEATLRQAPDAISEDMETVVAKQKEFVEMLDEADFDMAAIDQAALADFVDDGDFDDASEAIDDYLLDECGIEPDDDDTAGDTTPSDDGSGVSIAASSLIPDYETFVEFAMIGNGATISDEDKSCVVAELSERIALEDLQAFVDTPEAAMPDEQTTAVGLAFINCGVTFES